MTFYQLPLQETRKNSNSNDNLNLKKDDYLLVSFTNNLFDAETSRKNINTNNSNLDFNNIGLNYYVDNLLHSYEKKFCTYSNVNIFVTTFNVNGKLPPESLHDWLTFDTANLPDIIAIGLQEMDLKFGIYVMDSCIRQDEWLFVLNKNLPNNYKQIAFVRLIGIFLIIYGKEDMNATISQVHIGTTPTGFLKFGNKGGVGISLKINDTLVCFINSHLAAGTNELSKRNQDFREISQMRFENNCGIYDHEVVFWFGDLNYRLNLLNYEDVVKECNSDRFSQLFHFDQLKEQQKLKTAFNGFYEKKPVFRPTYKFDIGTSQWDSSEKRRVPAWCDRILYWVRDKSVNVRQLSYKSVERVVFSDHKPVCTNFDLTVKLIDKKKKELVYESVLKESDKRANELLPQVTVSRTEFNFGNVTLQVPSVDILTIKNSGLTPTRFVFSSTHQSEEMPNNWLTVTPKSSFLDVNAEVEVTLQVCVQNDLKNLHKNCELSSILVIRLDKGRDYFITVTAQYKLLERSESNSELQQNNLSKKIVSTNFENENVRGNVEGNKTELNFKSNKITDVEINKNETTKKEDIQSKKNDKHDWLIDL